MIRKPILLFISIYKIFVSPILPSSCRFYPTCSSYAYVAFELHGPLKGVFLSLRRLLRCHPYSSGGYDPVPEGPGCAHNQHELVKKNG